MNKKYTVTYKDSYNTIPRTEIMTESQLLFKQCCDSNFKVIRKVEYINEGYQGYQFYWQVFNQWIAYI